MDQLDNIATEMGLNIGDVIQTSAEEIRFNLFWRHAYALNEDTDNKWAYFLLIPYFEASGGFSPGKNKLQTYYLPRHLVTTRHIQVLVVRLEQILIL